MAKNVSFFRPEKKVNGPKRAFFNGTRPKIQNISKLVGIQPMVTMEQKIGPRTLYSWQKSVCRNSTGCRSYDQKLVFEKGQRAEKANSKGKGHFLVKNAKYLKTGEELAQGSKEAKIGPRTLYSWLKSDFRNGGELAQMTRGPKRCIFGCSNP